MATILFSSERARKRFEDCKAATGKTGDTSLQDCVDRLARWACPYIHIGCDFDKMSFTFREELTPENKAKGYHGVCGGIIYHGPRDGFGAGAAPTFSVTVDEARGYRIHT